MLGCVSSCKAHNVVPPQVQCEGLQWQNISILKYPSEFSSKIH